MYIYIYLYINGIQFELGFLGFHIGTWPKWDLNPQPRGYRAHALTTELSGQTVRCA